MGQVHSLSPNEALVTVLCISGRVLPPRSPSLLAQQAAWYNQWNKAVLQTRTKTGAPEGRVEMGRVFSTSQPFLALALQVACPYKSHTGSWTTDLPSLSLKS